MNRILILLLLAMTTSVVFAADPALQPFQVLSLPDGNPAIRQAAFDTTGSGTGFNPYPYNSSYGTTVQYQLCNLGTDSLYVVSATSQSGVATITLPTAGTNTAGAEGNAFRVAAASCTVKTYPANSWFNAKANSGTQTLEISVGQGSGQSSGAQGAQGINGTVFTQPQANSTTNISGTVTAGGTFQTIAAANTSRKAFEFQNICNIAGKCANTTDVCYIYFGTLGSATTSNSIALAAGASYLRSQGSIPTDAANATCTTTGDAFAGDVQ